MHPKGLWLSFSVIILLFVGGTWTLHSSRFHNHLLFLLQKGTGWQISLKDSKIRILRGILMAHDVQATGPGGNVHISADRVLINLSALSLLSGKVIVKDLQVDRPTLSLKKAPDPSEKTTDLLSLLSERLEKTSLLQNLILDHVEVTDFTLRKSDGASIAFSRVILSIEPNLLRQIRLEASLNGGSGAAQALKSLDVSLTVKRNGVDFRKVEMEVGKIRLSLKGGWEGNLEKGVLKLEAGLEAPTVLLEPLHLNLDAILNQKVATLKKLEASLGKASLEALGSFDIPRLSYNLTFIAKDLPLESIFQKLSGVILSPAKGIGEARGTAVGTLPALKAEARASIRDFHHGPLASRLADGTVKLDWPVLSFEAFVKPGTDMRTQATVRGDVLFKFLSDERKMTALPGKVDLKFENASLADIVPSLNVSGRLDGNLDLQGAKGSSVSQVFGKGHAKITDGHWLLGPMDFLETDITIQPEGKIEFARTSFHIPGMETAEWPGAIRLDTTGEAANFSGEPASGLSIRGAYQKESKTFRITSLQLRRNEGSLDGSLSASSGGRFESSLKGTLNLEWLPILPALFREGRGFAHVDLQGAGTFKAPTVHGRIEFLGDEIGIRGVPQELSNLKGSLVLNGVDLIPDLSGQLGDGAFNLSGRLRLSNWRPQDFDLKLKGSNLTLARPGVYRIDFDADVSLKGPLPSPLLSGRVDIVDGRYTKDFVIRGVVTKLFEASDEPSALEAAYPHLGLALTVKNSGDLKIKNNIASINLRSDLSIEGTQSKPQVRGAMIVTEGTFHYLGEDFTLNEGRLDFLNPAYREPYLTLTAEQDIPPDTIVTIYVKGYLSNLEIALNSSPALPREDIISLISSGQTREQIRENGRARRSATTNILGGEISSILEHTISKRTGLDIFRLEASESSGRLSRLSLGKHVTDRLSFELRSDFDPQTPERTIQANYYLTDNVLLKGFRSWTNERERTIPHYQFNISFRFRLF